MTTPGPDAGTRATIEMAKGQEPPVDPTANVLALVAAAMQRQDDLREAAARRQDDLNDQRDRYEALLTAAEARRIDAVQAAESRRLDALLAAQNTAVAIAATRAEGTASALAERVDTAAKTLAAEAGSKEQRTENRGTNQWAIGLALSLPSAALALIAFVLLIVNQP